MIDPYTVLRLDTAEVTDKQVAEAAKKIIRENHPDKLPEEMSSEGKQRATQTFMEAKEAWDLLRTAQKRKDFAAGYHGDNMLPHLKEMVAEVVSYILKTSRKEESAMQRSQVIARMQALYADKRTELLNEITDLRKLLKRAQKKLNNIKAKGTKNPIAQGFQEEKQRIEQHIREQEQEAAILQWKKEFLEKNYET